MTAPSERDPLRALEHPLSEAEVREGLALADLLAATFEPEIPRYPERTARNGCVNLRRLILARRS